MKKDIEAGPSGSAKRTFYEMLGVPHDADQAQIDTAYASTTAKLNAANLRGVAEAGTEAQLIRDGYQILSDPAKRARYDAKLSAAESGVQLMFFPEDSGLRRKLGVETAILLALVLVLSGVVYSRLSREMEVVRVEHIQAITREKEKSDRPITVDMTKMDAPGVKAGGQEQKR